MKAKSRGHALQGLVCAHGYRSRRSRTLPLEGVFVALDAFHVDATVEFLPSTRSRIVEAHSNGRELEGDARGRIERFLLEFEKRHECRGDWKISLRPNFPASIGIGSSAAVYSSVAVAAAAAASLNCSARELSSLARLGSYSAAAAVTGNVSVIRSSAEAEQNVGEVICSAEAWPFQVVVIPIQGYKLSEEIHAEVVCSTFYDTWLKATRKTTAALIGAVKRGEFGRIGTAAERHIFNNMAVISTGPSSLISWTPETLRAIANLREIRRTLGSEMFISMNSGPAVFAYLRVEDFPGVADGMERQGFDVRLSRVGQGARLLEKL